MRDTCVRQRTEAENAVETVRQEMTTQLQEQREASQTEINQLRSELTKRLTV